MSVADTIRRKLTEAKGSAQRIRAIGPVGGESEGGDAGIGFSVA